MTHADVEPLFQSLDDFDHAVQAGAHPLDKLDPETITRFRDSLVFRDGRVVGMDHETVRASLSPHDYIDLMYEFGVPYDAADPRFAGIEPPHPSAPQPGRDYCAIHGPPVLGAALPPPAIPDVAALDEAIAHGGTPLATLPPDALRAFRDGLGVNPDGTIHTIYYLPLKQHLSAEEYQQVLSLLVSDTTSLVDDYWCSSRGTCSRRIHSMCVTTNCSRP